MKLAAPTISQADRPDIQREGLDFGTWQRLPRPAILTPAARPGSVAGIPVVIDAWVALQALRAAADAGAGVGKEREEEREEEPGLDQEAVSRIALEHLLIGSAITGTPITEGGGVTGYSATDGGVTGPTSTDSYLFSSGDSRTPVYVCVEPPARSTAEHCESRYGRRAVVAVLDTGVREHWWLDVAAGPAAGGYTIAADGFVAVSQSMQDIIHLQAAQAASGGDWPRQLIKTPWDQPVTADPLIGEIDTHTGHGTFIAGIVRQVAPPDAMERPLLVLLGDRSVISQLQRAEVGRGYQRR
jgi:hypothetical protein